MDKHSEKQCLPEDVPTTDINFGHYNEGASIDEDKVDYESRGSISSLTKASDKKTEDVSTESKGWGARHTLSLLIWSSFLASFLNRICFNIAIVSMVSSNNSTNSNANDSNVCPVPESANNTDEVFTDGEFDWDEKTQGMLLGCFYYGYLVTNFLGGIAVDYFGGKLIMIITVLGSSILSLLSPICARSSLTLFVIVRVLSGVTQGPLLASGTSLIATWIPPQERAKICSFTFTGHNFGTVLSMAVSGFLIGSGALGGWPIVFYVYGAVGVLWTIPWVLFVYNRPEDHPNISADELSYIKANESTLKSAERVKIPWSKIATSLPFWSLIINALGINYGYFNLVNEIPTYLKNIQHFDIEKNGVASALPYVMSPIFSICWGIFVSYLIRLEMLRVVTVRKLSNAVAMFGQAIGLVVMCFVDCDPTIAIVVLCFSVGISGTSASGADVSEQDIAPNLAGTLKGLTNGAGSLMGVVAPYITGSIIAGNQTLSAWRTVFIVTVINLCVSCVVFLIFGTDKVQPWNEPKKGRGEELSTTNKVRNLQGRPGLKEDSD